MTHVLWDDVPEDVKAHLATRGAAKEDATAIVDRPDERWYFRKTPFGWKHLSTVACAAEAHASDLTPDQTAEELARITADRKKVEELLAKAAAKTPAPMPMRRQTPALAPGRVKLLLHWRDGRHSRLDADDISHVGWTNEPLCQSGDEFTALGTRWRVDSWILRSFPVAPRLEYELEATQCGMFYRGPVMGIALGPSDVGGIVEVEVDL